MARTQILGMCALWPWLIRIVLGSRSWHTLESWTISVCNIIQIKLGSKKLWPGHGTQIFCTCTVTLTLEIWSLLKVMDNHCVKHYSDPNWQWGVMPGHRFWVCVHCDFDLGEMTLGRGHDKPLGHGQQLCGGYNKHTKRPDVPCICSKFDLNLG